MADFVHLHCHSEYSMLDGAMRLDELCARACEYGMPAVAVTDHANLCGHAQFQLACRRHGIRPVFGCEFRLCDDRLKLAADPPSHLVLLAANLDGWRSLSLLSSLSWTEGWSEARREPRIDWDLLSRLGGNLFCLSACLEGALPRACARGDMDQARALARRFARLFPGRFYIELVDSGIPQQDAVNERLCELAETEGLPLVATGDCHYLDFEDAATRDVLRCIKAQTTLADAGDLLYPARDLRFKSAEEMQERFASCPEGLANACAIASACRVELPFGRRVLPSCAMPEGRLPEEEFQRLAREGLERRLAGRNLAPGERRAYDDRLAYETGVIVRMGFAGYFLIVAEFIAWARSRRIPVGPGRGSAGGSLAAWAMGITSFDPLPHGLVFERFLNPERASLPDIDTDICERRRGEVIRHLIERYGEGCVAQIATFSTLKMRGVIQDAGRVLGMPFAERTRLARHFPAFTFHRKLADVLAQSPDLQEEARRDGRVRRLVETALRLEGLPRQVGMHAAGIVMSDGPLAERIPLMRGRHGELVTQFDGPMVEKTGLVKFDLLGLTAMTVIQDCLESVRAEGGRVPDPEDFPLDDPAVYRLYRRAETDGVFQMESRGMKLYLRKLRPERFSDLAALLALYRPGPLESGMAEEFIRRRHGEAPVSYPHPSLEDCLKDTYGVVLYQEQVMQIAQIAGGLSLGEADLLRRAMSKKDAAAMSEARKRFLRGCAGRGLSDAEALAVFAQMETFASYGFNKAHSVAYALTSYWTAWLAVHYPAHFMAALLTSVSGWPEKTAAYLALCREREIPVDLPCVNVSAGAFSCSQGRVRFGLNAVAGVGAEASREIVARRARGPYLSLEDFCARVSSAKITRRTVEALIRAGAFSFSGLPRTHLLAMLPRALAEAKRGERPLLRLLPDWRGARPQPEPGTLAADEPSVLMRNEQELLGACLSCHPLDPWTGEFLRLGCTRLRALQSLPQGSAVRLCAMPASFRETKDRRGRPMAFLELEDGTGRAKAAVFDGQFLEKARQAHAESLPVFAEGRLDLEGRGADGGKDGAAQPSLALRRLLLLEECAKLIPAPVSILVQAEGLGAEAAQAFRELCARHQGWVRVRFVLQAGGARAIVPLAGASVTPSPAFYEAVAAWRDAWRRGEASPAAGQESGPDASRNRELLERAQSALAEAGLLSAG